MSVWGVFFWGGVGWGWGGINFICICFSPKILLGNGDITVHVLLSVRSRYIMAKLDLSMRLCPKSGLFSIDLFEKLHLHRISFA